MSEIRWTWDDASLVRRGLEMVSPFHENTSVLALDAITQLERQSLRDQRRPVCMMFRGKELRFTSVKHAITFLRPHADHDRVTAVKQRQPWENIESLLGDMLPEASKARVRGALHCTGGHPIQTRVEGSNWWFQERKACHVCDTTIGYQSARWHCTSGCNYNVCNHCFQSAVWNATQIFAEKSTESRQASEASTSEGPTSDEGSIPESAPEGPRVELQVQVGCRKELWTFDARPLNVQLAELVDVLGLSSRLSWNQPYLLFRNCGSDIEILHSEPQLHSLVPLTAISIERLDVLVSTCMDALAKASAPEVASPLRHLLALVCVSDTFANEAFKQGAFSVLIEVIRLGGSTTELACAGICALLAPADRRLQAMTILRDTWSELGSSLIYNLLLELFDGVPVDPAPSSNATLTLFLWLLDDLVSAAATAHAVCQGGLEANGSALYSLVVHAAQGDSAEGFRAHAGRLVLCIMMMSSTHQVAQPELLQEIKDAIESHATTLGAVAWLESMAAEHGFTELLTVLTRSSASPAALELQLRQQELDQLRDEKKFSGMLQGRLRQSHRALLEMVPFVKLGDTAMESRLEFILRHGWEAAPDWGAEGYTLLHYLCEYTNDTRLIRLVAGLCTDLEARDLEGNRPIDYALLNKNMDVAQCIVEVAQDRVASGLRSFQHSQANQPVSMEGLTPCSDFQAQAKEMIAHDPHLHPCSEYEHQDQRRVSYFLQHSPANQPVSMEGLMPCSDFQAQPKEMIAHDPTLHPCSEYEPQHQRRVSFSSWSEQRLTKIPLSDALDEESEQMVAKDLECPTLLDLDRPQDMTPKGPTPDGAHVGTVYMLRTQLTAATRENAGLREKAGEVEMLRTRLAILMEEKHAAQGSGSPRRRDCPKRRSTEGTPQRISADVPESQLLPCILRSEESPVARADKTPKSMQESGPVTPLVQSRPSGSTPSAKGKGDGSISFGIPIAESSTAGEAKALASQCPAPIQPPIKGKGKGKGKSKGPQPPPKSPDGSGSPEPAAKGDSKGQLPEQVKGKGKGKTAVVEPTKPNQVPSKDLKSIPWTRFVKGSQIEEGTTIWDEVNKIYDTERHMDLVPVDEIEQRFSKAANDAGLKKPEKLEKKENKKDRTGKLASISQDQRFQIEVSLRTLPLSVNTGNKAVMAIRELNKALLSAEAVSTLHRFLCPNEAQVEELALKRQLGEQEYQKKLEEGSETKPELFEWDPVEQYMEDLAQVPACSMRLSCWGFLYNLPDRVDTLRDNLDRFEQMVHCVRTSQELPSLLAQVLAFGNYLNGGRNEKRLGQADGFHIEMLGRSGGLDVVNDPQGRNVRQLIFKVFFTEFPDKATRLMLELSPMFSLVQRRLVKDSNGVLDLKKSVRVQIEDIDRQLALLKKEFNAKHKELKEGLQLIEDPADKFVVEIPQEFERERKRVDELVERKDIVLQQFKALLAMYKAETYRGDAVMENGTVKDGNPKEPMTSEVWCKIWDDFFVVKSLILSFDEKKQKEILEPRFCKDALISVDSLKIMWRLQDPKPTNSKKKAGASRGLGSLPRHSI